MTIDEAIERLEELVTMLPEVGFNKWIAGVKLGIEALKAIRYRQQTFGNPVYLLLPGETP